MVLVAVNTAEQAHEVLAGDDGLLSAAEPGTIVVLLSTVTLETVRTLSALCDGARGRPSGRGRDRRARSPRRTAS